MTELLRVADLRTEIRRRRDSVHPVDGVSFTVRQGETVGLVGESGCGKTMTAMSVMNMLPSGGRIVSGSVHLSGQDLVPLSPEQMREIRGAQLATVFQDPMTSLNPTMTVGDQIAGPVRAHLGQSRAAARRRAEEVLGLVGVPRPAERLDAFPHQLSGGLRQRVMIAMALACEPKLLIADEPTTALDVTVQAQILDLLKDLQRKFGLGMLFISHDLTVVAQMAGRVAVMRHGLLLESGTRDQVFLDPRHPYTQSLLGAVPSLSTDRRRPLATLAAAASSADAPLVEEQPGHWVRAV